MRLAEICRARLGLLGYGREGRAAERVLRSACPEVDLTVLVESGEAPCQGPMRLGEFDDGLQDFDVLLRSPGVPVLHPALQRYRAAGGKIVNPASIWFAERPKVPVVGVTGSKGKSTTVSLLAHILRAAGRRVLLAGNIGVPLIAHLDTDAELVVLELSSYQLTDLEARLAFGVIKRLFPEHGDWHGGVEHYYASKLRMIDLLQGAPLLINARDEVLRRQTERAPNRILGNCPPLIHRRDAALFVGDDWLTELGKLRLMGRHNLDNAALALQAADYLGADLDTAVVALAAFQPLSHRLELVEQRDGVCWINDSIATTPHATLAALQALTGQAVVLIAGGYVRPSDWTPVLAHCGTRPLHGLVLLPDSGPAIAETFSQAGVLPAAVVSARNLQEAVASAAALAAPDATVLLSPGAASFPHFRDFEDRGNQFSAAVAAFYKERSTA